MKLTLERELRYGDLMFFVLEHATILSLDLKQRYLYVLCETETEFVCIIQIKVTLQNFSNKLSLHCNPHNINIWIPLTNVPLLTSKRKSTSQRFAFFISQDLTCSPTYLHEDERSLSGNLQSQRIVSVPVEYKF